MRIVVCVCSGDSAACPSGVGASRQVRSPSVMKGYWNRPDATAALWLPALVVAYQQFADATRVTEVTQRNGVAHPGFLPPNDLKVSGE